MPSARVMPSRGMYTWIRGKTLGVSFCTAEVVYVHIDSYSFSVIFDRVLDEIGQKNINRE